MADYFECAICHKTKPEEMSVKVQCGRYKVCTKCQVIIFEIAKDAARESVSLYEACGGAVVSATKELNEDQQEWCEFVADDIVSVTNSRGSDIIREKVLDILENACRVEGSPFNQKSKT